MNWAFTQSVNHNVITIFLAIIHSSLILLKSATIGFLYRAEVLRRVFIPSGVTEAGSSPTRFRYSL